MNKLIAVDACRCLAVIQDAIDTLERIICVNPALFTFGLDLEAVFGRELTSAMRKYMAARSTLENQRNELASIKAAGFKARLKSIQRKIEASTEAFQKAVKHLALMLSAEAAFFDKLEAAGVSRDALKPQTVVLGGGGTRSVASGSLAQDQASLTVPGSQTNTLTQGAGQGGTASLSDLIGVLQALYQVVDTDMQTSADQERQRKARLAELAASERASLSQLQTLRREFDVTLDQHKTEDEKLDLQISTVNEALTGNAEAANSSATQMMEQSSAVELRSVEAFNKALADVMPRLAETQRRLNDLCKRHREQAVEVQRGKRRSELQVRNWIRGYDEKAEALDAQIYRLRHEINISRERIAVLEAKIQEYNEYRAKRDSTQSTREEDFRTFMLKWALPEVVYETQHKEFG